MWAWAPRFGSCSDSRSSPGCSHSVCVRRPRVSWHERSSKSRRFNYSIAYRSAVSSEMWDVALRVGTTWAPLGWEPAPTPALRLNLRDHSAPEVRSSGLVSTHLRGGYGYKI